MEKEAMEKGDGRRKQGEWRKMKGREKGGEREQKHNGGRTGIDTYNEKLDNCLHRNTMYVHNV